WTTSNFSDVLSDPSFLRWILNAFLYAVGATVLNVLFSGMAGYALSRLNFPGKEIIFVITLAVMMIPLAVKIISPQVRPALVAVAIITCQGAWNDFMWPLVALGTRDMYTLPVGLFFYK